MKILLTRKWGILALIINFFLLTLLVACTDSKQSTDYIFAKVSKGDIRSFVSTSGTVTAVGMVEVGSQLSGQIQELYVDFNDEVKKDQVLVKLDPRTYEARVRQDLAQVEIAKANLTQQLAAEYRARVLFKEAQRLLKRNKELVKQGHISKSDTDRFQAERDAAEASLSMASAQVENAKAVVRQREEAIKQSKLDLERTVIRSPVNGTVIERAIELGQTVAASFQAPKLFTIAQDLSAMQVEASVDEADIGKIKQGQKTVFTVDAYPDEKFWGEILQIRKAPTEIQNVITYKVIISAPNPEHKLLPGMTANVEVTLGQKQDVLMVPNTALRFKPSSGGNTNFAEKRREQLNPDKQVAKLTKQLKLSEAQQETIRAIYQESFERIKDVSAWRRQREMQSMKQKINSAIENLLDSEQKKKYQQMTDGRNMVDNKFGAVWILNKDGQPEKVSVKLGLSDDDNTEIEADNLIQGDQVIIRASLVRD